ncbi:MAG: ABC transporter substrate-binding protein [Rhodobacter sp.]|jgi:ABC-type amino acid transport substrate-binding protein/phage tail protein X|uniref:LysM peptidoglycan-binding domain-containing protein n=1 Tax=Tabrizicola sp. TaxID=2005166 RepID=UPI001D4C3E23|nr:LysM peptidoglycan-binding domain-containing protein [Tabrizicola sp.]MBA3912165.1 ABC transporter substrate-binding protein [Rhodobacter sp.]MBY0352025.1 LysM peptidoglycan-binding domain-containing protein [Tabrizicola sp.]
MRTASHLLWLPFLAAAMISLPIIASAQEACTTYSVKDGDTLGSIAQAAYGTFDYQNIFNANRDALAANPNSLPAGLQLVLPCADGRLAPDQELSSVIQAETEKQQATAKKSNVYEPPLKFVTSNNWAPFTDESLTGGGIFVRMATTAMQRGGNNRAYTVAYVDDWMSHIDTLLPSGAFDVSIAWEAPDCSKLDMLGEFSTRMCTEFDFSLPIYEAAYTFNTLPDSKFANARAFSDYAGAKLCRPEAWPMGDLEVQGLAPPVIEVVQPKNPLDCAEMLMKGEVDIYSIETETSVANFKELGVTDKVVTNPALTTFISYHFLTSKNNPRGRVYIAMLNRGITEMRESGEWYDILATGLAEFNKKTQ